MSEMICPLTCPVVKSALKAHEERGVVIAEYIDYFKKHGKICSVCARNDAETNESEDSDDEENA